MLLLLVNEFGNFMCGRMSFQFIFLAQQMKERERERGGGERKESLHGKFNFIYL